MCRILRWVYPENGGSPTTQEITMEELKASIEARRKALIEANRKRGIKKFSDEEQVSAWLKRLGH